MKFYKPYALQIPGELGTCVWLATNNVTVRLDIRYNYYIVIRSMIKPF